MSLIKKLIHLVIPHETNNHKAKILHSGSLTAVCTILIVFQIILTSVPSVSPSVLGYAANISADEVIRLTNEKRAANGLAPLSHNPTLSSAALAKGADMINKDYWAHVAPDGTQPWKFFTDFGYRYRYAGENLARDFSNAASAVDAWMASPTHKENLLSSKYKEIGIGVIEGDMAGVDTTIIVQFFGSSYADTIPTTPVAVNSVVETAATVAPTSRPTATPTPVVLPSPTSNLSNLNSESEVAVLVSPFNTTKGLSLGVVAILLAVLLVDWFLVSKRRISRISSRNLAHFAFLGMILTVALILKAGQII